MLLLLEGIVIGHRRLAGKHFKATVIVLTYSLQAVIW